MAERHPLTRSPMEGRVSGNDGGGKRGLSLLDESLVAKWRTFEPPGREVHLGSAVGGVADAAWSVSPGEWTVLGARPEQDDVIDLTDVRALLVLVGPAASHVLAKVCSLDFSEDMFPSGRAVRTSAAGVVTEIVRLDRDGRPAFLLVPSRSFAHYLHEVLLDAGAEFGLA